MAWYNALLYRQDPKKLPKRAEELWSKPLEDQMSVEMLKKLAWAMATHKNGVPVPSSSKKKKP